MKSYLALSRSFRSYDNVFSRSPRARHRSPLQTADRRGRACPARPTAKHPAGIVVLALAVFLSAPALCAAADGVAATPPIGWNSWDCYGTTVTEAEVKANADYMAHKLKQHGWHYIVIDIQWSEPNPKAHGYRQNAALEIDAYGRLIPAVNRFPSAAMDAASGHWPTMFTASASVSASISCAAFRGRP